LVRNINQLVSSFCRDADGFQHTGALP
jgi:hypothetical protein